MLKKWLAFSGLLALVIVLDPSLTPAQPPGGGGGGKGGFGGGGFGGGKQRGGGGGDTAAPGGGGGFGGPGGGGGFGGPGGGGGGFGGPGGGGPGGGGFGGPGGGGGFGGGPGGGGFGGGPGGGGFGGPGGGQGGGMGGGGRRGMDPEKGWSMLQNLTGSAGDTVDLSKIQPQQAAMLRGWAEKSGGIPLPESGIMTKAAYFEHQARSEAQRAAMSGDGNGGGQGGGGWGQGGQGWGQGGGGWGQGGQGWGQGGDPNGGRFEKKDTEEEKPVAMRYGKLPKDLPAWFEELDTDKDGQVGLYEWRKGGKDYTTEDFMKMDLNGDGLITADEYLRFARLTNIEKKKEDYEEGTRGPGNWGLGEKLDAKGDNTKGNKGPGNFGPGQWGNNKGGGGAPGADNTKGGGGWGGPGGNTKGGGGFPGRGGKGDKTEK